MRLIKFTPEDVEQDAVLAGDVTELTGTDVKTDERVTVKVTDASLANALISFINKQGVLTQPWADFQVVKVEPVRGDWDSPGTSPEDGA